MGTTLARLAQEVGTAVQEAVAREVQRVIAPRAGDEAYVRVVPDAIAEEGSVVPGVTVHHAVACAANQDGVAAQYVVADQPAISLVPAPTRSLSSRYEPFSLSILPTGGPGDH